MNFRRLINRLAVAANKMSVSKGQPHAGLSWKSVYQVGKWTYGEPQVLSWEDGTTLTVGAYCSIAPGVQIYLGGNHHIDFITTFPFAEIWGRPSLVRGSFSKGDIIIGNDVWLASKSVILSGVKIGDGAVVGACAVVARDVAPYSVVAGNPARVIRKRFSDPEIHALLNIQWWNWDDEKVEAALPLLMSNNVGGLVKFSEEHPTGAA